MQFDLIREHVLRPVGKQIRHVKYSMLDALDQLLGRQDELMPPRRMVANIGGGDYRKIGNEFLPYFIELGHLQPHERVLEVGCGVGRMAVALLPYLQEKGRYDGIDIVSEAIEWCQRHITPRNGNFAFHQLDVYNKKYNPQGTCSPSGCTFPFDDASFDFVFLTSVFTHMLPADMERYLHEISRVLKPGGRCLITFFLLNKETQGLIDSGVSKRRFDHALPGCRVKDRFIPEREVAYEEEDIRALYARCGLVLQEPIRYGSWCNRPTSLSYQDMILARKGTGA